MFTESSVISACDRNFSRDVTSWTTLVAIWLGVRGGVRRTS
jgi:hypothetical protein